jgi:hypothetical protein
MGPVGRSPDGGCIGITFKVGGRMIIPPAYSAVEFAAKDDDVPLAGEASADRPWTWCAVLAAADPLSPFCEGAARERCSASVPGTSSAGELRDGSGAAMRGSAKGMEALRSGTRLPCAGAMLAKKIVCLSLSGRNVTSTESLSIFSMRYVRSRVSPSATA